MNSDERASGRRPDLQALDVLVGRWTISGDVTGETTFSWLDGGHFLRQDGVLTRAGVTHRSLEIIGPEKPFGAETAAETITSRAYTDTGDTLDYTYELLDGVLTVWGGPKGSPASCRAELSPDGTTLTGAWHWPGGGYDFVLSRVVERPAG